MAPCKPASTVNSDIISDIIPGSDTLQLAIDLRVQLVTGCNTKAKQCGKRMYLKECVPVNVSVRHLLFI